MCVFVSECVLCCVRFSFELTRCDDSLCINYTLLNSVFISVSCLYNYLIRLLKATQRQQTNVVTLLSSSSLSSTHLFVVVVVDVFFFFFFCLFHILLLMCMQTRT